MLFRSSGGSSPIIGVYNSYNREIITALNNDTNSWSYGTASWRATDNSTSNRISYIDGLGTISPNINLVIRSQTSDTAKIYYSAVNLNSTSNTPTFIQNYSVYQNTTTSGVGVGVLGILPSLGFNYLQSMEYASGSGPYFGNLMLTAALNM